MSTPDPRRVTTFRPGWLQRRVATSVALLDSLPPKLRASLAQPDRRRHPMTEDERIVREGYPKTAAERQAMRAAARRVALERAEVVAAKYGRSITCGNLPGALVVAHHADEPGGCANDGSGCLCVCHDPKETP